MDEPEFHRLADRELNEAAQYYDLENPGLGSSFLEEVARCLQSIEDHPEAGMILQGSVRAEWYPDSRGHESQAAPYLLGGSRVTLPQRPSYFCLQPTADQAWAGDGLVSVARGDCNARDRR